MCGRKIKGTRESIALDERKHWKANGRQKIRHDKQQKKKGNRNVRAGGKI